MPRKKPVVAEPKLPRSERTKNWRMRHSDGSEQLSDQRRERFCRLISEGMPAIQAFEQSGYSISGAHSNAPYRLLQTQHIVARIRHLEVETARARGEDVEATKKKVRARLEEIGRAAFHSGQYSVAKDCEVLIGKDVGMFRDRIDHNFTWDGDPRSLTEGQLHKLITCLEAGVYGDDAEAINAGRKRALAGPQTVDVTGEAVQ